MAEVVRELRPARTGRDGRLSTWELGLRELRIELYARRWVAARLLLRELPRRAFRYVCRPFDQAWLAALPADIRSHALTGIVEMSTANLEPAEEALAMLEAEPALSDSEHRFSSRRSSSAAGSTTPNTGSRTAHPSSRM